MSQIIELKNYKVLETEDQQAAIQAVTFPVTRARMNFTHNGQNMETERDAIFRLDGQEGPQILGYASPEYKLVPHADVLQAAFEGMNNVGMPFSLKNVSLDRNGAKMMAQFQVMKPYQITPGNKGDVLYPVLTLVNSYDGLNALSLELESMRLVCLNLAKSAVKDVSQRFLHVGGVSVEGLLQTAQMALENFENKLVPFYRQLGQTEVSKELAVKAVAVAVKEKVLPLNVASFAKHCVESDRAEQEGIKRTAWAMYNGFTWATSRRGGELSPLRHREIRNNVAKLFADGGTNLLKQASEIEDAEITKVFERIA
jgi:hypothetical protein